MYRRSRADAGLTVNYYCSGVRFDYALYDAEPQAAAAELSRSRLVHSIKTIEDSGQFFAGDSDPGIGNRQMTCLRAISFKSHLDLSTFRGVLNRIVQQVA